MRSRRSIGIIITLVLAVFVAAGCGGGGKPAPQDGRIVLAGTEIPTVSPVPPVPPTPVVCSPPASLSMPANFPRDFPVPPDFVVWSITTSPHLHVEGRVSPPRSSNREPLKGIVANSIVTRGAAMGWKFAIRDHIDGQDYTFSTPDGRTGHFNANQAPFGCEGQVVLILDADWVTG